MEYNYTIKNTLLILVASLILLSACGDNLSKVTPNYYPIGGTVNGLEGVGLTLQNNGKHPLEVSGTDFTFKFDYPDNADYNVTVSEQPTSPQQTCEVNNAASGKIKGAAVTDIVITCNTDRFTVGGFVAGLIGTGLELTLNNSQPSALIIEPSQPIFTFNDFPVKDEAEYSVAISTQPIGQTCFVATEDGINIRAGTGTIAAENISTVGIQCVNNYTIGGMISGLDLTSTTKLVLQNNAVDNLIIVANGGFTFDTSIADGTNYDVSVLTQPSVPSQTCTVNGDTNNKLVKSANVTSISVICSTNQYSVGGTVTGLVGSGLVLKNAGEQIPVSGNSFTFSPQADGSGYLVSIGNHPVGQSCEVTTGGSGTLNGAAVIDVAVNCNSLPMNFAASFGFKKIMFTWNPLPGIDYYQILENPDGVSGFNQLPGSGDITGNSYTHEFAMHLFDQAKSRFRVEAYELQGSTPVLVNSSMDLSITDSSDNAIGYFKASVARGGDQFGGDVSLSADGLTLAVGAYLGDIGGQVHIYERNSSGNAWNLSAKFMAPDVDPFDWFGNRISLSADGNTLAVGVWVEDSAAKGVYNTYAGQGSDNSAKNSGAVFVYTRNVSNGVWDTNPVYIKASNTDANDWFGVSVSLSANGNTLVVGASKERSAATGINNITPGQGDNSVISAGAVYVYTRDPGTMLWNSNIDYIKAPKANVEDRFAGYTSLSADGNTLAVELKTGVYLYIRDAGIWSSSPDFLAADRIGAVSGNRIVSLSADGYTLAVGTFREFGEVAIFTRNADTGIWVSTPEYFKLTGGDRTYAYSISLSGDGNTLAIQSWSLVVARADSAVRVFTRANKFSLWERIFSDPSALGENIAFGSSISLNFNGDTLAIGAPGENSAATGYNGDRIDGCNNSPPTNCAVESGAAFVY